MNYLSSAATARSGSKSAVKVKVKDVLHNVDITEWPSLKGSSHSTPWHSHHCILPLKLMIRILEQQSLFKNFLLL